MSYSIGQFAGAIVAIAVMALIFRFAFKHFLTGTQVILASVGCAVAVATFLYAFGSADGGDPKFGEGFAQYGIGGVVVLIIWLVRTKNAGSAQ